MEGRISRVMGFKYLSLLVAAVCAISGCRGKGAEPPVEKTQLELWHYWDMTCARQTFQEVVDGFNRSQDQIEVRVRYIPDEDFKKQLALNLADGTAPDLAIVDSSDVKYFHSMRPFVCLDPAVDTSQYLSYAMAACEVDGKAYGVPLGVNCLVMYYNMDILSEEAVPVPQTPGEFIEAAKRLTKPGRYGCALPTLQSEETIFCLLPLFWADQGSLDTLDTMHGRSVFDWLKILSESGGMGSEHLGMTLGDISREFQREHLAMMFATTMAAEDLRQKAPDLHFDIAPLPVGAEKISVIGGEMLTVTEGARQDAALEFVRYATDRERMAQYVDRMGYLAPRMDVLEEQIGQSPEKREMVELLKTARPREFSPDWPKISDAVSKAVGEVVQGSDVDGTLKALKQKIEGIRGGADEG